VIVDTHCHLNFNSFKDDLPEIVQRARQVGVTRIVVPGIDIETSREVIALSHLYPDVYAAIGIHPNDAVGITAEDINVLRNLASDTKVVAIGEIGLDNFHKDVPIEQQINIFVLQLKLAGELALPVLVHNRDADQEIQTILTDWIFQLEKTKSPLLDAPGILHAFSSDLDFARKAISLGFYLGAAGPITFRNAADRQKVFQSLPLEKIVIETDAPFLAPHPFRGKRNEPSYCVLIVQKLAELWQLSENYVAEITSNNASRIFRWKEMTWTN
jgi:TatD DNase family protein